MDSGVRLASAKGISSRRARRNTSCLIASGKGTAVFHRAKNSRSTQSALSSPSSDHSSS